MRARIANRIAIRYGPRSQAASTSSRAFQEHLKRVVQARIVRKWNEINLGGKPVVRAARLGIRTPEQHELVERALHLEHELDERAVGIDGAVGVPAVRVVGVDGEAQALSA
jgi:hypothetical protein